MIRCACHKLPVVLGGFCDFTLQLDDSLFHFVDAWFLLAQC
jgi:hypothetical protein